jgi:hypothetical protein
MWAQRAARRCSPTPARRGPAPDAGKCEQQVIIARVVPGVYEFRPNRRYFAAMHIVVVES